MMSLVETLKSVSRIYTPLNEPCWIECMGWYDLFNRWVFVGKNLTCKKPWTMNHGDWRRWSGQVDRAFPILSVDCSWYIGLTDGKYSLTRNKFVWKRIFHNYCAYVRLFKRFKYWLLHYSFFREKRKKKDIIISFTPSTLGIMFS